MHVLRTSAPRGPLELRGPYIGPRLLMGPCGLRAFFRQIYNARKSYGIADFFVFQNFADNYKSSRQLLEN